MGMKSYCVHLKNKYPKARVVFNDSSLEVILDSELILKLEKNAHGQILDVSETLGLSERFCLAPIPKEARAYKLFKDGKIGKAEEHDERKAWSEKNHVGGKILSEKEYAEMSKANA